MVIVLVHAFASAFIYVRDRFRMVCPSRNARLTDGNNHSCFQWRSAGRRLDSAEKDAFLPILDATNVTELREAVHDSIKQCLPKVERVKVFLKNPVTEQMEAVGALLPTHGVVWDAFIDSTVHICSVPPEPDPVLEILHLHPSDPHKVLLLPISSRPNDFSLGIVVACLKTDGLSIEEEKCLNFLVKQVSVVYFAVRQPRLDIVTDSSRLESLIALCGELHDQDAATLELKVIRYLREQTCAESGFLLLVVPETLELISQVVGNMILPEEVRFPGLWSCFAPALETKKPVFLEHIPADQRGEVEKIAGVKVHSFVCIPVARKGSEDLIALACLVNKINEPRFTENDIQIVQQCFKYTATVLTSTLAFQNERKLKNQTQALLHVARKLFTRLGESNGDSASIDLFIPFIFPVTRFIHGFRIKHPVQEGEDNGLFYSAKKKLSPRNNSVDGNTPAHGAATLLPEKGEGHRSFLGHAPQHSSIPDRSTKKRVTIAASTLRVQSVEDTEKRPSCPTLDESSSEEFYRKMALRRKRTFSISYFRMYDPICLEAVSLSDSDSEFGDLLSPDEEDDSAALADQQRKQSSSGEKPATTSVHTITVSAASPKKSGDAVRFLQQGRNPVTDTQKCLSVTAGWNMKVPTPVSRCFSDPARHKSTSPAEAREKSIITVSSSGVSGGASPHGHGTHGHYGRKTSRFVAHVPFCRVRKLPAENFRLPDGSICPYITFLLRNAPSDGAYSDGDFVYDLTKLLREIMQEARNLTDAERCSVFLLDQDSDELVATVFDGITTNNKEVQSEIRLPKTQGIAGHVATTGTLLNIKDAYSHPLFYRGVDDSTGFRTRNILCFPIKDEEGVVLGVAQLCNKKTGTYFTTFDEDIASAFAVYCCISISHCLIYKKLQDTQHRQMLTNELLKFHMQQIPQEEVQELAVQGLPHVQVFHENFDKFSYPPRLLPESRTAAACQAMFEDLGFVNRWRLKSDTLARFLLMVKKGYRNPPYHNWMHAFAVTHFGYLCIKNLQLANYLEEIELLALFVSCLCHDIDHRGTTNSFQVKSQSVLAALYSSEGSVMERHHLAQSMCILNTEGSNIFENLSSREYQQVLDLMRDIILATDLAHHLRIFDSLEEMAKKGYKKQDPKNRNLLLCLLMTASDLSDQTKSWDNTKHIAVLIYQEFFSQGDLEKALGESPLEMMDRERACVPDLQISFLDNIAIPVYRVLAEIFPEARQVHECVENNRKHWVRKAQLLKVHNNSAQTMSVQEIIALGEGGEMEENMDTSQQNGR